MVYWKSCLRATWSEICSDTQLRFWIYLHQKIGKSRKNTIFRRLRREKPPFWAFLGLFRFSYFSFTSKNRILKIFLETINILYHVILGHGILKVISALNLIWNLILSAFVIFNILTQNCLEILDFHYNFRFTDEYIDLHDCIKKQKNSNVLPQNISIFFYMIFRYTCAEYFNILAHNISIYFCRISIYLRRIYQYTCT